MEAEANIQVRSDNLQLGFRARQSLTRTESATGVRPRLVEGRDQSAFLKEIAKPSNFPDQNWHL